MPINRLIQADNDKLVEVGSSNDGDDPKKLNTMLYEYNILLSTLLETQREFYHKKLKEMKSVSEMSFDEEKEEMLEEKAGILEKIG